MSTLGPPSDDQTVVVLVGWRDQAHAARFFDACSLRRSLDNGVGVRNEEQGTPVLVCGRPSRPWSATWPDMRHLD